MIFVAIATPLALPFLKYNFVSVCTVKNVVVDFTTGGFLDTNTVVVVLVRIASKSLKPSPLFPSYKGYKIACGGAVGIIISYKLLFVNKNSAPNAGSEESTLSADAHIFYAL